MKERFHGEFDDLAQKFIDAEASDEERQRFAQLMREDEALRYRYAELMRVHALLISRGSQVSAGQTCQTCQTVRADMTTARLPVYRRFRQLAVAAAAALVIGLTAWLALAARQPSASSGPLDYVRPTSAQSAVYVCSYAQVVCRHDDDGLELPEQLPGTVRLPHGRVKVRLSSGVDLTLLGPLELKLDSPMSGRLVTGRLLAYVAPDASGFMLHTPDLEIWDIGTVFGVTVDAQGSDVFVFKGAVQVVEASGDPVDLCHTGEGVRARRDGSGAVKFVADGPESTQLLAETLGRCVRKNVEASLEASVRISDMWAERWMPKVAQRPASAQEFWRANERRGRVVKTGVTAQRKDNEMKANGTTKAVLAAAVMIGSGVGVLQTSAEDLFYSATVTGPGYYPWDDVAGWVIYNSGGTPYGQLPTTNDNVRINATTPKAENGNALTVTNGVFAECNLFAAGDQNYPGTAWFRLDGGSLTCATHFITGRYYPGLATLASGTLYGGETFSIGSASRGTVTNDGAAINFNRIGLGTEATAYGTLVQNGGSIIGRTEGLIGRKGYGLATLNGGLLSGGGNLFIGHEAGGDGTVTNNGASVTADNISMGYVSGASGRLVHNGGSLSTAGILNVGRNGGIGEFEADAPFSARLFIVGTGLAPTVPGTGTVTMAEGAVAEVGEYLRVNNGDLFLRGGQIHLQNVGNPNRTNLYVRTGEDRRGQLSGWGYVGYTNENITLRMLNNGQVVADGEGVERDLDFNMIAVVNNDIPNNAGDTNGWYAVNKGRLLFPRSMSTAYPANTPTAVCSGDLASKTLPELVNSIGLTMTYSETQNSGARAIRGGICATDRSDIPSGLPESLRLIGVWFVGSFNNSKLAPSPATFSNATATFRYDHMKLKPTDSSLRLFRYDGSAWVQVGSGQLNGDPLISTAAPLAPVASGDYNIGWFAAMAVERKGTMISVH